MKLDKRAVNRLLALDDEKLKEVIVKLGAESGLDLSSFNISADNIAGIRAALSTAGDEELRAASEQLENFRKTQK